MLRPFLHLPHSLLPVLSALTTLAASSLSVMPFLPPLLLPLFFAFFVLLQQDIISAVFIITTPTIAQHPAINNIDHNIEVMPKCFSIKYENSASILFKILYIIPPPVCHGIFSLWSRDICRKDGCF